MKSSEKEAVVRERQGQGYPRAGSSGLAPGPIPVPQPGAGQLGAQGQSQTRHLLGDRDVPWLGHGPVFGSGSVPMAGQGWAVGNWSWICFGLPEAGADGSGADMEFRALGWWGSTDGMGGTGRPGGALRALEQHLKPVFMTWQDFWSQAQEETLS